MPAPRRLRPITLDFETDPIENRPHYPPKPVSFSLQLPEWRVPKFYAWGHYTGENNCSVDDAGNILTDVWHRVSEAEPLLMQNAKFDLDVAETHFGLALPPWHNFHDTMFLLFLDDPHQRNLGLKPSAQRLLGMEPEERDAVVDWVLEHKKQLEADFGLSIKPSTAGAYVAYAPPKVVGPYANGDATRTLALFKHLHAPITVERGMGAAYDRERKCLPIFLRNEREGIRTDIAALQRDEPIYTAALARADNWLRKRLKSPNLDINSPKQLVEALDRVDMVMEWELTAKGNKSTSKKALTANKWRDPRAAEVFAYRQACATALETFIRPWTEFAIAGDGWMHTTWNQVRQPKGGDDTGGTRTGRPSSDTPNFLNMPKKMKKLPIPRALPGLPGLPPIRSYILPDKAGHLVGRRDFNQQELRILAHYEDAGLLQGYLANPLMDVHDYVQARIKELTGLDLDRDTVKTLNFGMLYGMGTGTLADRLNIDYETAKQLKAAQLLALPGLKALDGGLKTAGRKGECIRTWGGREYYVEPPRKMDNGGWQSFEYKLLNYLIQGSAADCTKESIIRYDTARRDGRFILTVYDENNISAPKGAIKREMLLLREVMMSVEFDVPMLSEGEIGPNLGTLTKLQEPAPNMDRWALAA